MDCQWGRVAPKLGLEELGARCAAPCATAARFCEGHLRRLAEAAVEGRNSENGNRYVRRFAEGLLGRLGAAVVDHWPAIVSALTGAYVGMSFNGGGGSGSASHSFNVAFGTTPNGIHVKSSFDPYSDWTSLTVFAGKTPLKARSWEDLGEIVASLLAPTIVLIAASEFDAMQEREVVRAETLPIWHDVARERLRDEAGAEWVAYTCRRRQDDPPSDRSAYVDELEAFRSQWPTATILDAIPEGWLAEVSNGSAPFGRDRAAHDRLREHLAQQPNDTYVVALSFADIETIIGKRLPAPAFGAWSGWWLSGRPDASPPWTDAGFGISSIAHTSETTGVVEFVRGMHRWPESHANSIEFAELPPAERLYQLAEAYVQSARILCERLGENSDEVTWPRASVIYFCYRHAVELFLKSCILHKNPLDACDHDIGRLRKQYATIYPESRMDFETPYDVGFNELEEILGVPLGLSGIEKSHDQIYRYFGDRHGAAPRSQHYFSAGSCMSMIERLEADMNRIRAELLSERDTPMSDKEEQ